MSPEARAALAQERAEKKQSAAQARTAPREQEAKYTAPAVGVSGTIDCHNDLTTCPLLPSLMNFEAWTGEGSKDVDLIFKYQGKILDRGNAARVLEDSGKTWIRIAVTSGKFTGQEGYVFRTCINK